jgi:hypothetical protein
MASGYMLSQAIVAAARLGIADLVKDAPRSIEGLAQSCAVNADALYRTLRALACVGIFTETGPRTFANSPLSEPLRSDLADSIRPMILFLCDEMHWKVYGDFMYSVQTGKPSFDHVYGQKCWEYLVAHPDAAKVFDDAMTSNSAMAAAAVAESYDFSGAGTLVDVAGGNGLLLGTILRRYPSLQGVLFDVPHSIERARNAGLVNADRCRFIAGDFFASVPAEGDVYMLKNIIHDWDDASARRILETCRTAMQSSSRLLIIEWFLPPANQPGLANFIDLEMLVLPGGRERSTEEMGSLLARSGFNLTRVIPTKSPLAIFEAMPV